NLAQARTLLTTGNPVPLRLGSPAVQLPYTPGDRRGTWTRRRQRAVKPVAAQFILPGQFGNGFSSSLSHSGASRPVLVHTLRAAAIRPGQRREQGDDNAR